MAARPCSSGWLWLILPGYGAYAALTDGISRAWVADVVPAEARGTALGIHAAISGVGLLAAGLWAGLAWHGTGRGPFMLSGAIAAALAATVLLAGRSLPPHRSRPPDSRPPAEPG